MKNYVGRWWLPSEDADPDTIRHGVLTHGDDGRLQLELTEGISTLIPAPDDPGALIPGNGHFPLLYGRADSQDITLLSCRSLNDYLPQLGPRSQRFTVDRAAIGAHLRPHTPIVKSWTMEIENLTTFLDPGGEMAREAILGKYGLLEPVSCGSFEHEELTVRFGLRLIYENVASRSSYRSGRVSTGFIQISSTDPGTVTEVTDLSKAFLDLITFASDQPSAELSLTVETVGEKHFRLLQPLVLAPKLDGRPQDEYMFLFTARDVTLQYAAKEWLSLWFRSRPAIDIMLSSRYVHTFSEVELLTLATAGEALSSAIEPTLSMRPPEEFTKAKKEILAAIESTPHVDWVRGTLRNDPTFRRRLEGLAALVAPEMIRTWAPDVGRWAKSLRDARGNVAHGVSGDSSRNHRHLIEQTRYLLALVLMTKMGVSVQRQAAMLTVRNWVARLADDPAE